MKHKTLFILLTFISYCCVGQTIIRGNNESQDSIVLKLIGANSKKVGKVYEFNDSTSSIIIYFEIKIQDSSNIIHTTEYNIINEFGFSEFTGKPTLTLFNILLSSDEVHYTKLLLIP